MKDAFSADAKNFKDRLVALFPERQLLLRANGQVRFVRLSPRMQVAAVAVLAGFLAWNAYSSLAMLSVNAKISKKNTEIEAMQQTFDLLSNDYERLNVNLGERAERLEKRQRYLEQLAEQEPLTAQEAAETDAQTEAADPGPDEQAAVDANAPVRFALVRDFPDPRSPDLSAADSLEAELTERLDHIDRLQRRAAAHLAGRAEQQSRSLEAVIAKTRLPLDRLLELAAAEDSTTPAMGGPYFEEQDLHGVVGPEHPLLDTRQALDRLSRLDDILQTLPSIEPPDDFYISSHYGMRRDPYTKRRAFHSGIDMAGWPGTKIAAAAPGTVVEAGYSGAYGIMVEIDHGNGLRTRYGHMRRLKVKAGDRVDRGQTIGEMGSTGRSTSTHLHYEIWFDGKPVNPHPFVKAAKDVLQTQRRKDG
ncbi:MAG: peptidoglycan DD-metalloendopeptidase family protein [Rhodothalassiaceae bacterium]